MINTTASYLWSFGDGTTSTAHDPWHLYATTGMYFTCLDVTLPNGTTCSYCDSILGAPQQPSIPVDLFSVKVKLTPNPVNTSFLIAVENVTDQVDLEIRDFTGHSVHHSSFIGEIPSEIQTSMLDPGYYYYTVQKDGQIISQGKLIVMH